MGGILALCLEYLHRHPRELPHLTLRDIVDIYILSEVQREEIESKSRHGI